MKIDGVKLIKCWEEGRTGQEFIKCTANTVKVKCSQILKQSNFLYLVSDASQAWKTSKEKELNLIRTKRDGNPTWWVVSSKCCDFGMATAHTIIDEINSIFHDKKKQALYELWRVSIKSCYCNCRQSKCQFQTIFLSVITAERRWTIDAEDTLHKS